MRDLVMASFDAWAKEMPLLSRRRFALALALRFASAALLLYPLAYAAERGEDATHVALFYAGFSIFGLTIGVVLSQTAKSLIIQHELLFGKHRARWVIPRIVLSVLMLLLPWYGFQFFWDGWLDLWSLLVSVAAAGMFFMSFYLPALDKPQVTVDEED